MLTQSDVNEEDHNMPANRDPTMDHASEDSCSSERQEVRAMLRERFIRAVMSMNGKPASFHMYENTNVSASYGTCDREFENIHATNLQTPLGPIPNVILRANDIVCIHFPDINPSL